MICWYLPYLHLTLNSRLKYLIANSRFHLSTRCGKLKTDLLPFLPELLLLHSFLSSLIEVMIFYLEPSNSFSFPFLQKSNSFKQKLCILFNLLSPATAPNPISTRAAKFFPLYSQYLIQCLAHSRCFSYWRNDFQIRCLKSGKVILETNPITSFLYR